MASIKSDAAGFLLGEPVKSLTRAGGGKAEVLLSGILGEVRTLRQAVVSPTARGGGSRAAELATIARFTPAVPTGRLKGEARAATTAQPGTGRRSFGRVGAEVAQPAQRDGRGRFIKKAAGNDGAADSESPSSSPAGATFGALRGRGVSIADAVGRSGIDEADPAVKAFGEIAQPIARGYSMLSGGDRAERQKTGWFRKIFGELRMFRAEETGFSKAAGKSLKALEEKPEAGAAAGGGGMLGTVLNGIKTALPGIATVLGGLAAAMAPLLAMLKVTEWAADTTHDKERVEGIKEGAAAPAKEALQAVGIDSDKRVEERRTDTLEKRDGEYAKEASEKVAFKAPPGVKEGTTEYNDAFYRYQQAKEAAAAEQAKKHPVRRGWEAAKGWVLGQTSKIFESGKGGAGTVSTGKGDHGGASYGTYQLSSAKGRVQEFLKDSKYGAQFAGLKPGSAEFNAKWKEVAKNDPAFGDEQHDFIKRTHYDLAMKSLKKSGIDLSGKGAAVQDSLWSTSVHLGPEGAASAFRKATKGRDVSQMTDADIVTAVQDYKLANNDRLFAKSSPAVRAGTASRAVAERSKLLALATKSPAPIVVSAPPAMSFRAPSIPAAPETPPVTFSLSSSTKPQLVAISQAPADVGQDLRDRRIAHIATGGVSN